MSNKPIQKLNKRLIYGFLVLAIFLVIPALVWQFSSPKKKPNLTNIDYKANASQNNTDVLAISGVDKFPEHYGMVKDFEAKIAQEKEQNERFLESLDGLEKSHKKSFKNNLQPNNNNLFLSNVQDNPWLEAKKREQKQLAFDYYDASRSSILFFDGLKDKKQNKENNSHEDKILGMMERSLAMAQAPSEAEEKDLFFIKQGQSKDVNKDFLSSSKGNINEVKNPMPFMVSEGTLIHAILLSEINTDLPGPILARVSHNIWDSKTGKTLLIPQNSKLIGEYNSSVGNGQNRAQIAWTRIIYPNQQSVDLSRMVGVDPKGVSGSAGNVDNHYDKIAMGLFMSTALGVGVKSTQGKHDPNTASFKEDLGHSLAQETHQLGNKIIDQMLAIKPTIKVPLGERLNVFVEHDLNLKPYNW